MAITQDDKIRSTPRAMKDPKSYEYARQMVYVLKTVWGRVSFDLKHWDKELEEAKRNKIWLRHKPKYGSLEELLAKEVGFSDAEYEVKKKTQIRNLSEEHPDWTQQQIADEVGCSKPYVNKVLTKKSESDESVNTPDHLKSRTDKADFRKLPHELQEKVRVKEVSLNAAAIQAGIRKKPTPEDACFKAFRKCSDLKEMLRRLQEYYEVAMRHKESTDGRRLD